MARNGLRLNQLTYPNGAKVEYRFGGDGSGELYANNDNYPDRLNQVSSLKFWSAGAGSYQDLVAYQYNGASRLVLTDYEGPDIRKDMFARSSGAPTADYTAWDRFGRTLRSQWDKYNSGAGVRDKVEYTYDYAGNRLSRNVDAPAMYDARDYVYTYDGLMRLTNAKRGTYSGGSISGTPAREEHWDLDQLGNWEQYATKSAGVIDLDQVRYHTPANEIEGNGGNSIAGTPNWADPVHDAAGNMTTVPKPAVLTSSLTLKYDAWNRLASAIDPGVHATNPVAKYEYDGFNRRIVKTLGANGDGTPNEIRHFYYNDQWQVVEERVGADGDTARVDVQYVWHPEYVDALAMRFWDSDQTGGPETYHYSLQDANYNVTALVNSSGDVVERYAYTPYGVATILNGASDAG